MLLNFFRLVFCSIISRQSIRSKVDMHIQLVLTDLLVFAFSSRFAFDFHSWTGAFVSGA